MGDDSPLRIAILISLTAAFGKADVVEVSELLGSHADRIGPEIASLQRTAVENGNLFERLMEVTKVASLGQISRALYDVGGQYRRNM